MSGCVLIVPTGKAGGAHCGFAGRETSCGTCMAARCGAAVDTCCADDACGGIIGDLEACSVSQGTKGASCERLLNAPDGDGVHRDISTCAKQQCHDVCAPTAAGSGIECKPAYAVSVDACTCSASATPNGESCTSIGHANLRCCAPTGWPAPPLRCSCLTITCDAIGGGCSCRLNDKDDNGRATECPAAAHCCKNTGTASCTCSSKACLPQETEVESCTIAQLGCSEGEHEVEACSAPQ